MKTIERFRKLLVDLDIDAHSGYPLAWDVKIAFHPSVEQTLQKIAESFYLNRTELFTMYPHADKVAEEYLNRDDLFESVVQDMWDSWIDADTYSMCTPERLKAWGLPYGMKALGVRAPFRVKYGLVGRSNGHLVVEEFEGVPMQARSLAHDAFDDTWVRQLGAMTEEWNDILQPTKVYDEYKYTIAWRVNNLLEDSV